MLKILYEKIKESVVSILPVCLIVIALTFTPLVSFTQTELITFCVCAVLLIVGMALFNLGADLAMTPMGEQVGAGLTKLGNFKLLVIVCFLMGTFITIAEPDLSVLATQVKDVINSNLLIYTVGIGVGIFLVIGIIKIVFKVQLSQLMMYFYMILFAIASVLVLTGKGDFLSLAFDSGGVTTGPITVPFIMALGVGISSSLGSKTGKDSSFGLIALCSVGPILAVLVLGLFAQGEIDYVLPDYSVESTLQAGVFNTVLHTAKEVLIALGLIVAFFFILQVTCLKLPKKRILQIVIGIIYTFFGLVIFLSAVNIGFMPIGFKLGTELAQNSPVLLAVFGFILGAVVVLAEPAIHVLNNQVEEVTGGTVSKRSMLIALSVGVGVSLALSMIRIIFDFSVLYILIPGYAISLGLSFFVPKMYTAIAFDSGGVASGPLTSCFILPLAIGVCTVLQSVDLVLVDAFGLVSLVAMTPLITIQALGFKAVVSKRMREKSAIKRILNKDDEQIINFM